MGARKVLALFFFSTGLLLGYVGTVTSCICGIVIIFRGWELWRNATFIKIKRLE